MSDTETFESIWDALAESPVEAENMKQRSTLMRAITARIKAQSWTQTEAARRFGVQQPRISHLMNGRIDLFSVDTLLEMASLIGLHVEISVLADPAHA
jgi:predicted XRE-type DNA-binding protein